MTNIQARIESSQTKYIMTKSKEYLKSNSQIFTPIEIAKRMVDSIDKKFLNSLDEITILEPSAGCGILIFTVIDYILKNSNIKIIKIDGFETDLSVCKILKRNVNHIKNYFSNKYDVTLKIRIYNSNFITYNKENWTKKSSHKYDLIISNPPYKKINQTSDEAIIMNDLVYGQPNIYILFIAMSLKLLNPNGLYIVLSPRNYLNGTYSKKLRQFIFSKFSLTKIHFFEDRNLFGNVNQEVIISTFKNSKYNSNVQISTSNCNEFNISIKEILYNKDSLSIIIPRTLDDIKLFKKLSRLNYTINELNIKVCVGPIVQFRNLDDLSSENYNEKNAPLLVGKDIQENNQILYNERINVRKTHNKSVHLRNKNLIKNSNYLILRKVTAKDDKTLLISSVLKKDYFNHSHIALDNNLLYFANIDKSDMDLNVCYGLYCFITSIHFQNLYYMINGTHTINVSDVNSIKFPCITELKAIGNRLLKINSFTNETCTLIIDEFLQTKERILSKDN